jgi:hypothetical protein
MSGRFVGCKQIHKIIIRGIGGFAMYSTDTPVIFEHLSDAAWSYSLLGAKPHPVRLDETG